jgi:Skp family chaperone for outer membrane proteins
MVPRRKLRSSYVYHIPSGSGTGLSGLSDSITAPPTQPDQGAPNIGSNTITAPSTPNQDTPSTGIPTQAPVSTPSTSQTPSQTPASTPAPAAPSLPSITPMPGASQEYLPNVSSISSVLPAGGLSVLAPTSHVEGGLSFDPSQYSDQTNALLNSVIPQATQSYNTGISQFNQKAQDQYNSMVSNYKSQQQAILDSYNQAVAAGMSQPVAQQQWQSSIDLLNQQFIQMVNDLNSSAQEYQSSLNQSAQTQMSSLAQSTTQALQTQFAQKIGASSPYSALANSPVSLASSGSQPAATVTTPPPAPQSDGSSLSGGLGDMDQPPVIDPYEDVEESPWDNIVILAIGFGVAYFMSKQSKR